MEDRKEKLNKAGLKSTPVRLAVLDFFDRAKKPVTAGDAMASLKGKIRGLDTVTLYRTLHSFEEKGLIRSVDLGQGAVSYEAELSHHHHIVCTKCARIEGFELCAFDDIEKAVLKQSKLFSRIDKHSFELFGVCKSCGKGKTR